MDSHAHTVVYISWYTIAYSEEDNKLDTTGDDLIPLVVFWLCGDTHTHTHTHTHTQMAHNAPYTIT